MFALRRMAVITTMLLLAFALTLLAQPKRARAKKDNAPKVGDVAPDFTAKFVGKDKTFELKKAVEQAKKPIVFLFGSYT